MYVLSDKGQQYAKSIPKWTERSRVGVYLGHLPQHARSVGLVLNLATGHMSPQFHCVYDDQFLTVWAGVGKIKSKWQSLARLATKHKKIPDIDSKQTVLAGKRTADKYPRGAQETGSTEENKDVLWPEGTADDKPATNAQGTDVTKWDVPTNHNPVPQSPTRRLARDQRPTQRMLESIEQRDLVMVAFEAVAEAPNKHLRINKGITNPIAFASSADPDIMYLDKAMRQPDKHKFIKAMVSKFDLHSVGAHWRLVPKTAIQSWNKLVPAVWAMRRKRRIDTREVYKWKARLNMHSGKMTRGVHYDETHSPVVRWSTI